VLFRSHFSSPCVLYDIAMVSIQNTRRRKMFKNKFALTLFAAVLILSMLACNFGTQATEAPAATNTVAAAKATEAPEATEKVEATTAPEASETVAPPAEETEAEEESTEMPEASDVAPEKTETPAEGTEAPSEETETPDDDEINQGEYEVPEGELGIGARTSWKDEYGTWEISGLIVNNTDETYSYIEVEIEIFDANDKSLYKTTTYMSTWTLGPGEISTFVTSVSESDIPEADSFTATILDKSIEGEGIERPETSIEKVMYISDAEELTTYVTGEIVNNSDQPVYVRAIPVALFDAKDELISISSYASYLGYIMPGESGPFSIMVDIPEGAEIDSYYIADDIIAADTIETYDVEVSQEVNMYIDDSYYPDYHVVGTFTNNSDQWLSIKLVAAVYSKDGDIVDVVSVYPGLNPVKPGETQSFDASGWSIIKYVEGSADEISDVKWWLDQSAVYESSYVGVDLTTSGDTNSVDGRTMTVKGKVDNATAKAAASVYVSISVEDKATGKVLAYAYTWVGEVAANGSADYETSVYLPEDFDPEAVNVVVTTRGSE
jgi:hypothetical protein